MRAVMSSRDRRTLAIGASFIGAIFGLGRGLPALLEWQAAQRTEAIAQMSALSEGRHGASVIRALRDSAAHSAARLRALDSSFVTGPSAAAAAANLAAIVDDLADSSSVRVSAMQLRGDSVASGSLVQVAVHLTAVADVFGVMALLHAIDGGRVLMTASELSVSQSEPGAPESKQESLRVELTVVALARLVPGKR